MKILGNTITVHQESLPIAGGTMGGSVHMNSNSLTGIPAPSANDHAVNKKYADDINTAANNAKTAADKAQKTADEAKSAAEASVKYTDSKHILLAATLSTNWTSDKAPYKQSVTVDGILESDTPHIYPVYSSDLSTAQKQKEAWAMVSDASAKADSIEFICFEDKPAVEISLQIEVNR